MKPKAPKIPAYVRKVQYLHKLGALHNGAHGVTVYHDNWCGIWQQRRCNCNPDVKVTWSQTDASQN